MIFWIYFLYLSKTHFSGWLFGWPVPPQRKRWICCLCHPVCHSQWLGKKPLQLAGNFSWYCCFQVFPPIFHGQMGRFRAQNSKRGDVKKRNSLTFPIIKTVKSSWTFSAPAHSVVYTTDEETSLLFQVLPSNWSITSFQDKTLKEAFFW